MKLIHGDSFFGTETHWDEFRKLYVTIQPTKDLSEFYSDEYFDDFYTRKKSSNFIKKFVLKICGNPAPLTALSDYRIFKPFVKKWGSFLEIGSGDGDMLDCVKSKFKQVIGLEMDVYQNKALRNTFPRATILNSNYETEHIEGHFDVIYLRHVLEHVVDYEIVLKKIKTNLAPEGIAVINVPNAQNNIILKESIESHPHTFHFTKDGLRQALESAEYKIDHIDTYSWITSNIVIKFVRRLLRVSNLVLDQEDQAEYLIAVVRHG